MTLFRAYVLIRLQPLRPAETEFDVWQLAQWVTVGIVWTVMIVVGVRG